MKKKKNNYVKKVLKMGVTNIVGVGMIGATAGVVNSLPTGTGKTIAGVIPGLQSVALVGENLKMFKKPTKKKKRK